MFLSQMFLFHTGMMLALIAIALGVTLIIWAARNQGKGILLAKVFGWLIILIAIFGSLCSDYFAVSYWYKGYFQTPPSMARMDNKSMSDGMTTQGQ